MYQSNADKLLFREMGNIMLESAETHDKSEQANETAQRSREIFGKYIIPFSPLIAQQKRFESEGITGVDQQPVFTEAEIKALEGKYTYEELLELYRLWSLAK
jgi:hypothetical protein